MNDELLDAEYLYYSYMADAKQAIEMFGFGDFLVELYATGKQARSLTIPELEAMQVLTDNYEA
jgi:hypothetical protein